VMKQHNETFRRYLIGPQNLWLESDSDRYADQAILSHLDNWSHDVRR
jgi:hypothetical protein